MFISFIKYVYKFYRMYLEVLENVFIFTSEYKCFIKL